SSFVCCVVILRPPPRSPLFPYTTLFRSGLYGGKVKNTSDLFGAGGRSPWWVSGLSGFMTMFSAGTFVVWGGIAYKHGLVAVSIKDRKSTRLNSSHVKSSYAVFCLKKKRV